MSPFEIDHGEPSPERAPQPVVDDSPADRERAARLREALPLAVARIRGAQRLIHVVDLFGIGLVAICGQGLGGIMRTDPWTDGATLGVLAALAGIGVTAWMWRRSRVVAEALWTVPVPLDDNAIPRHSLRDERQRAVEYKRRDEELAHIEMLDADLALCRSRLRLALWGAAVGMASGWVCALAGPNGMMSMAASVAALPGAVLGWRIAAGAWSVIEVQLIVMGALPACALVAAFLGGTTWYYALAGAALVVAAGWFWRQRIDAIVEREIGLPVVPAAVPPA